MKKLCRAEVKLVIHRQSGKITAFVLLALLAFVSFSQPFARGQEVVATAKDGGSASAIAYDPAKGEVFVANFLNGTVTVLSDSNDAVVATVAVGAEPDGIAYDSGKSEVFVANAENGTVTVISDSNNAVVATVPVGFGPSGVAYDPSKGEVFVASSGETVSPSDVSVISDTTNTVVDTINVNQTSVVDGEILQTALEGIAYDPAKSELFVANYGLDSVIVIADTNNSVVATVPVGSYPSDVAYDPARGEVFVANSNSNFTSIISDATNKVIANVTVGEDPVGVAYDPSKGQLFVTNVEGTSYVEGTYNGTSDGTVSVISDATNKVVANVTVGLSPGGIAYDSGKGELFVLSSTATLNIISDGTAATTTSKTSSSLALQPSYAALVVVNVLVLVVLGLLAATKGRNGRALAGQTRPVDYIDSS
jgi:YVTN family beta-propeller protein